MKRRTTDFQTIRSEGGLLPPDLLRLVKGDVARYDRFYLTLPCHPLRTSGSMRRAFSTP